MKGPDNQQRGVFGIMKLICAIVRNFDSDEVVHSLVAHGYRVTRLASTGGFLRHGNATLLIGAEDHQVADVIETIRAACLPPEGEQHRATIFVMNLLRVEHL